MDNRYALMRIGYQKKRIAPFILARAKSWLFDHFFVTSFSIFSHLSLFIFYNSFIHQDLTIDWDGFITSFKINFSLFYLFYFFSMNYFFYGKTFGQQLLGIGAINNTNFSPRKLTAWSSIQRSCANYVCFKLGLVLFLIPLLNKKSLSLADIISETHQSYSFYNEEKKIAA